MVEQVGPVYLNGLTIGEANAKLREVFGHIYAGGVTPIGGLRDIRVMRGGREVARVDVYAYLLEGRQDDDVRLEEGDVVIVRPYELLVNVSGKVKRPMHYEMKRSETLGRLLDYTGGFTGDAYAKELRVIRETGREYRLYNVREGGISESGGRRRGDGGARAGPLRQPRGGPRLGVPGGDVRAERRDAHGAGPDRARRGSRGRHLHGPRAASSRARGPVAGASVAGPRGHHVREFRGRGAAVQHVLIVLSIHELEERGAFTIGGEVARRGPPPYAAHTTIEDFVVQAGGLLDGASTVKVDVSRRMKAPKSLEPTSELGRIYTFSLKDGLVTGGDADFELAPYDVVEIRRSPGYREQRRVTLDGEVVFLGGYTLVKKNERLSDLVRRAGGLTPDAYARGARLIRRLNDEERAVRETTLRMARQNNRGGDSLALDKLQLDDYYTVGIELDKALSNPDSDYDMVLREGDRLVIPEYVSTVNISGEVMYPNTVLYMAGKHLKYYIGQAGGSGLRAKRSKAYVIYMNGTVTRVKSLRKARIEPGARSSSSRSASARA